MDHPSFGTAIISRVLEAAGYRVGIISQPKGEEDYKIFGRPKLGFFINGGNIDSMVAHYTVAKRRRTKDYYSPGEKWGSDPTEPAVFIPVPQKRCIPTLQLP